MSRNIPEADWKVFRQVRETALNRFCQRVLDEISGIADRETSTPHERYLEIFKVLGKRDRTLADLFNAARRSTAFFQLVAIRANGLLTDKETERFSAETRALVKALAEPPE